MKEQISVDENKKDKNFKFNVSETRDKLSLSEYVDFANMIDCDYLVSPCQNSFESTGRKNKIKICLQSLSIYQQFLKLNTKAKVLLPIWIDELNNTHDYSRENYLS